MGYGVRGEEGGAEEIGEREEGQEGRRGEMEKSGGGRRGVERRKAWKGAD